MALTVTPSISEAPTNPKFTSGGSSVYTSGERMFMRVSPEMDDTFTLTHFSGNTNSYDNLITTKGFRIKCYDSYKAEGISFAPADFATRNYYVLLHSDNHLEHHFARITEIITEDVAGDAFEFEPKIGKEIPKGSKFIIFTGELKSLEVHAVSAGIKRELQEELVCSRPLFYFHNDRLDKKDELNHNKKYYATINGGTATSFALTAGSSGDRTSITFRTVQDFGSSLIDYSKYRLKISLTDKLRFLDNTISGTITVNEGQSITADTDDYDEIFPNARRDTNDYIHSGFNTGGPYRYLHYDTSPLKANFAYGVMGHENTESVNGKGGFAETRILDAGRIMPKKIKPFGKYRVRHLVHRGDLEEFFDVGARYSSTAGTNSYVFETDYDLGAVLNVGDEVKIDDKILVVASAGIGSFSNNNQTITFNAKIRAESDGLFATATLSPSSSAVLYRRAFNATDKTLLLNMDLIDSRFSKLYVGFTSPNMNDLYASVTACDKKKSMLTLSFAGDSYTGNPMKYANGSYAVFVERFNGEIEQIDSVKEQGQTIMEIKGRDRFNKLLSPIVNTNTLFSEEIVYSSNSPYNDLGNIKSSTTHTLDLGDTTFQTGIVDNTGDGAAFDNYPVVGTKLFTVNGYIGEVLTSSTYFSGATKRQYTITPSQTKVVSEAVFMDLEKNYILSKSLGSSHLATNSPTSLTGSANKGVFFTSGSQIRQVAETLNGVVHPIGADADSLVGSSSNTNSKALGYSINGPNGISKDRAFQAKLHDEFGSSSPSTFEVANTLIDYEIVSISKKDNSTDIEIAPYVPITLGRKVDYHFETSEYTFTQAGTVTITNSIDTKGDYFVVIDSTAAYALKVGTPMFVGDDKTFVGNIVSVQPRKVSGGSDATLIGLDRDVYNFSVGDVVYSASKPTNDLAVINGMHLWGGKILSHPHPLMSSTYGVIPLNAENINGSGDYTSKHGQMMYKATGLVIGNFDLNVKMINPAAGIIATNTFDDFTNPTIYKNRSLLNYYLSTYQFKPNSGSTNLNEFDKTDSSYRTFPLDFRGHTSPFGSNATDVRIHKTDSSVLATSFSASLWKNSFCYADPSALRLFLYINSDLQPYSALRTDSLAHSNSGASTKSLTNYSMLLLENKKTKDAEVFSGSRLGIKDINFQTINFESEQDVSQLKNFGLMRLTEVCFDFLYNPVNPEKPITQIERKFNSVPFQGDFTAITNTVSSISGTTISFNGSAFQLTADDYLFDATNGSLIGQVQSTATATSHTLKANGYLTNNGNAATTVAKFVLKSHDYYGRSKEDTFSRAGDNEDAIHPLKCVVVPDYCQYNPNGAGQITLPTDYEIDLPIWMLTTEHTEIIDYDYNAIRPLFHLTTNKSNSARHYDGLIGVALDRFDVETGGRFKLEEGETTQVLVGKETITTNSGNFTHFGMKSGTHYKGLRNHGDTGTSDEQTSDPFPVDGAYMVFKPRLWVGTLSTATVKSSNGNLNKATFSTSAGVNHFLNFIDLTGCYLVPEKGKNLNNTTITTGSETLSKRMVSVAPDELIYVVSHEVDSSTISNHEILTDTILTANTAYRVMQPNETCLYDFFPNDIHLNVLKPQYTKKANKNETYSFKSAYEYQEGTLGGNNSVENEGVLSMFVAIDTDYASQDTGLVIKDRRLFFKNLLPEGEYSMYFSDGDNGEKLAVVSNQDYSFSVDKQINAKGIVSVSQPFTVSSFTELKINPTRAAIGATATVSLESEDIVNELLEEEGLVFTKTPTDYPMYLAPNYQGIDLFSAIKFALDKKDMSLVEENGTFVIKPNTDSSYYNHITITDSGEFRIFEFGKTTTLFDFYNEIIVYGNAHRSVRRDLRSIQKRGRKSLEVVDDSLLSQEEVDSKAYDLLNLHSRLNEKISLKIGSFGLTQLRAGDIINVELVQEGIELSRFIVLQVTHELTGLMTLELGRYSKDLSDLFSELIISGKKTNAFLRSKKFEEKVNAFSFLDTVSVKELKLLVRTRTSGGSSLGFTTTLGFTKTLGFGGSSITITNLIEEDLA